MFTLYIQSSIFSLLAKSKPLERWAKYTTETHTIHRGIKVASQISPLNNNYFIKRGIIKTINLEL